MDFSLEPEQEEFRKIVRAFAEEVVAPRAEAMDRAEELDEDVLDQMAGMGLFGLPFPERYGGMGADYLTLCLAVEELARVDSSVAITLEAAVSLGAMPIYRFGSERQRERWLPPLARGERLGAFGLTEAGGGSDAGALRTRARLEGDEWVIDGGKAFITNAGLARSGLVTLAAVTGVRASPTSCAPSRRAGWRSPRSAPACARAASTSASSTRASATPSASRSPCSRRSPSRSPTWSCAPTPPGSPGSRRPSS